MQKSILILLSILFIFPLSDVLAESTYDINIPSGSADKNAPFHWVSEKDGDTSGFIEIIVGDTIFWKNGDTAIHTVTSGSPQSGPNGIFDSEISPGAFFFHKFTDLGEFSYYCTIHPWRTGIVNVVSGLSVLPNVGSDAGDGLTLFDIEYKFNRLVNSASIDEKTKSILFELKGNTNNDDNTLTLFLPTALISGVSSVAIDNVQVENFDQDFEDEITILSINNVPPKAKSITISGTTIIPEFIETIFTVLIISIIGIIAVSRWNVSSKLTPRI